VGVLIDMSAAIEVSFVDPIVREAGGLTYGLAGYLLGWVN
jgi:hypothetical protein